MIYVDELAAAHLNEWTTLRIPYVKGSLNTQWSLFTQDIVTDDASIEASTQSVSPEALEKLVQAKRAEVLSKGGEELGMRERQRLESGKGGRMDEATLKAVESRGPRKGDPTAVDDVAPSDAVTPQFGDLKTTPDDDSIT